MQPTVTRSSMAGFDRGGKPHKVVQAHPFEGRENDNRRNENAEFGARSRP